MRSTLRHAVAALASLAIVAVLAATAAAAEPGSYELADATHAGSLAITDDGTAWFIPVRGTEWEGRSYAILGSVKPDETVSERRIAGFFQISGVTTGPGGGLWVSGYRGRNTLSKVFEISRLSPTGEVLQRYVVGRGRGRIRSMSVSTGAVWLIREGSGPGRWSESVERIGIASGAIRSFALPPKCHAFALDVAPDGTPWFTQKCGGYLGEGAASKTSLSHIRTDGRIVRHRIAAKDYPVTLAIGPKGTVWFGAWGYYRASRIGRLTSSGRLAEFSIPHGSPYSIAVGPEGRLWFGSFRRGKARDLDSIGIGGNLSVPVCADPICNLEPTHITRAPDGSLWYGLIRPNYNTGGGGSGLYIDELIHNEAGFLGHLTLGRPASG